MNYLVRLGSLVFLFAICLSFVVISCICFYFGEPELIMPILHFVLGAIVGGINGFVLGRGSAMRSRSSVNSTTFTSNPPFDEIKSYLKGRAPHRPDPPPRR